MLSSSIFFIVCKNVLSKNALYYYDEHMKKLQQTHHYVLLHM